MKEIFVKRNFIFILLAVLNFFCFSQVALKSVEEEYFDFLSLTGKLEKPFLNYRTLSDSVWELDSNTEHIWQQNNLGKKYLLWTKTFEEEKTDEVKKFYSLSAVVYGPEWFNSYNTQKPYGQNDGALWQGRGYNTFFTAGARLDCYGFAFTFKPVICWSENKEFDYLQTEFNRDKHGYFWGGGIDLVQRYGDSSFWTFDWGDTEIRWSKNAFTLGVGFQSPWLGPSWLNSMLGSNNAGTFPKWDIGFRKTDLIIPWLNWNIGKVEGRIWNGLLTESDYFDFNDDNNYRMVNGLSLSYAPSFIPGFAIGINRVFVNYWNDENYKYLLRLFTVSHSNALASSGNDEDQKYALSVTWRFPTVGFEIYGELGIDDYTSQETANPFHTGIYTVGGKQYVPLDFTALNAKLKKVESELIFEWNNFEMSQDFQLQWSYMGYYSHGFVRQGYTQRGQIIGAGTGYAGNSQFIGWKFLFPRGYFMPYWHRSCPDNNYIYSKAVNADASNDASERGDNSISDDFYARFKTYKTYYLGFAGDWFVTPELNCYFGYECIWNNFPDYNINEGAGHFINHIELGIKYSF